MTSPFLFLSFFAFVLLGACSSSIAEPPVLPVAQEGWDVSREAPVLPAGDMRARALWNDPHVVQAKGTYAMFMTTSVDKPFQPPILPFRALSKDGVHWELSPKAPLLTAKGGPYVSIETPSVVYFRGAWHMFFTGIYPRPVPSPMSIGHAVSQDGVHWDVVAWERLKATGVATDWDSYLVGEPGAVVVQGQLYVYYTAMGGRPEGGPPLQSLAVITSSDGLSFSKPRLVLQQGDLYPARAGYAGYSSPAALYAQGKVHLFYSVVHWQKGGNPEWQQVAIHHAVSADGLGGFVEDGAPIVTRDSTQWATGEVLAPGPMIKDGKVMVWFGGHVPVSDLRPLINRDFKGPEFGIGLAVMPYDQFISK
ncbi:MAG: hypothetical protein KDI13_11255 [Alphaproteobacteria bacterium]|nr:hypothetical protein [Alphaproteobacteria bacterium]